MSKFKTTTLKKETSKIINSGSRSNVKAFKKELVLSHDIKGCVIKAKINPEWTKQYKLVQKELAKLSKIEPVIETNRG